MTGAFKEYRTKTPDSGPHGLAADKDGNIWFAAIFQGYIGKLDPSRLRCTSRSVRPSSSDFHAARPKKRIKTNPARNTHIRGVE
jgi:streptogramin lyase